MAPKELPVSTMDPTIKISVSPKVAFEAETEPKKPVAVVNSPDSNFPFTVLIPSIIDTSETIGEIRTYIDMINDMTLKLG